MRRRLLVGRAGTGKTARVVERVRELLAAGDRDGRFARFQVLLPTYSRAEHLKRQILRHDGPDGLFDRGIGTFEQLAERETGLRLARLAPPATCDLFLDRALAEVDAPVFREVARFPGFRRMALRVFKEVKSAEPETGSEPVLAAAERLLAVGDALPGERGRKLAGLARVLAAYQRRLAGAGLLDHEDLLLALLARLRDGAPAPLALLAVDGFADLTEVQSRIVDALARGADEALVTLQADGEPGGGGVFGPTGALRARLVRGGAFEEDVLDEQYRASGDLARLEALLAGEAVAPAPSDGRVRFLAGADPDDEADRVARTVLGWTVDGVPRSDILIVVRRLGSETSDRLLGALRRHGVPARLIGSAAALASPLLRAALRVVRLLAGCERGDDLLAALRGGAARDVDDATADLLSDAARLHVHRTPAVLRREAAARGLDGAVRWLDRLARHRVPAVDDTPERVAQALLAGVGELVAFGFDDTPERAVDVTRRALDAAALRRLAALARELAAGLRASGTDALPPAAFVAQLETVLAETTVTVLDRRVDVVNVVDAEEARQWEARAVVVSGLVAGEFPAGAREDLFVSDRDRDDVGKRAGVRLPSRVEEGVRRERALFYAAATRARERLVLTTSLSDESGDPRTPSPFLERALEILPPAARRLEGADRTPGDVRPAPGEVFHDDDLVRTGFGALSERFGTGGAGQVFAETGLALLEALLRRRDATTGAVVRRAAAWSVQRGAELGEASRARRELSAAAPRSASSLADFVQCPFRHFARAGLRLRERDPAADDGWSPLVAGDVVHRALESVFRDGATTRDEVDAALERAWDEAAGHLRTTLAVRRERALIERTVRAFVARYRDGGLVPDFRQSGAEIGFGFGPDEAVRIGGHVPLRGRIDRVDDARSGGRSIVLDYKWSPASRFSALERKIENAEDLQLPLYVLAAERRLGREIVAAGLVSLKDPDFRTRWLLLGPGAPPGGRADVDWTSERAAKLAEVEARVVELDRRIRAGQVAVDPHDEERCGPSRCPYADLCRYEEAAL